MAASLAGLIPILICTDASCAGLTPVPICTDASHAGLTPICTAASTSFKRARRRRLAVSTLSLCFLILEDIAKFL